MNDNIELVTLHNHLELIQDVVRILNLEWPRSESARIHSLENCNHGLPCSLLLVHKHDFGNLEVIGHSRLSKVHGDEKSVFLENVIIEKARRGIGLGRKLMELTELCVTKLGFKNIYLSTHNKCKFYEYLGYVYCSPVSPVRANAKLLTPEQFSALQVHFGEQKEQDNSDGDRESLPQKVHEEENLPLQQPIRDETCEEGEIQRHAEIPWEESQKSAYGTKSLLSQLQAPLPPPPPPPPPILPLEQNLLNMFESGKQFWMVKHL